MTKELRIGDDVSQGFHSSIWFIEEWKGKEEERKERKDKTIYISIQCNIYHKN